MENSVPLNRKNSSIKDKLTETNNNSIAFEITQFPSSMESLKQSITKETQKTTTLDTTLQVENKINKNNENIYEAYSLKEAIISFLPLRNKVLTELKIKKIQETVKMRVFKKNSFIKPVDILFSDKIEASKKVNDSDSTVLLDSSSELSQTENDELDFNDNNLNEIVDGYINKENLIDKDDDSNQINERNIKVNKNKPDVYKYLDIEAECSDDECDSVTEDENELNSFVSKNEECNENAENAHQLILEEKNKEEEKFIKELKSFVQKKKAGSTFELTDVDFIGSSVEESTEIEEINLKTEHSFLYENSTNPMKVNDKDNKSVIPIKNISIKIDDDQMFERVDLIKKPKIDNSRSFKKFK